MPFFRAPLTWFRLTFRWSNSAQTWQERVADGVVAGVLAVALVAGWLLDMSWWLLIPFCLGCLLLPCLVLRLMGWLKVFGPVLYYDMVRTARRGRFIWLRFLYALLLVFLLFCVFVPMRSRYGQALDARLAARIAQDYFEVFMVAQFITVVLLTPAYVAGAVSEEKDRKTLEFMLATDLLNREIVLSKLGSRLSNLALVVLTGLPILSILQFVGGVDPDMVVAGFVLTAMTIAGQAGLSILCSVTCKRPRDAIGLAYLGIVLYYSLSLTMIVGFASLPGFASTAIWFGEDPPTVQTLADLYNKGSLITVMIEIKKAGVAGTLATVIPTVVREYSLFHGALFLGCTALAIARVRRVALDQMYGRPIKSLAKGGLFGRARVSNFPMLWKELECEGGGRMNWIALVIFSLLLGCTLIPAALIIIYHCEKFYQPISWRSSLADSMNAWGRTCNVLVGCLTLLAVGVRASTSITSERDKQTMDALLTSPLDSSSILHAKWLGSIMGVRLGLVWLALIWAVGIVTGGLHMAALLLVSLSWLIFAAFVATLGLWFSVVCKTSLRATVLTIMTTIGLGVGHWIVWLCCGFVMFSGSGSGRTGEYLLKFQAGMTPPFVMGWLHFSTNDLQEQRSHGDNYFVEFTAFSIFGMVCWAFAAAGLYALTNIRFRQITNRTGRMHSDYARGLSEPPRRRRPPPLPIAPWAPPTTAITLEEAEEDAYEPLDHDDPSDWGRPR
jgi:ABC-type transport system involved in multi-copper enzyme maturation permease subunit